MYKLCFFVPESHLNSVKNALFEAGAGRYQNYDQCCWQTEGTGQFRPLVNSNPTLGVQGRLETVREFKVEMLCDTLYIKKTIAALITTHPYEEPAYEYWEVMIS